MARRTKLWTADFGRDKAKQFLLTEMPADAAEKWAVRAILALLNANVPVPEGSLEAGMAGFASILAQGVRSLQGVQYAAVAPLLDEMMDGPGNGVTPCVQFQPPGNLPPAPLWSGENSQIEEVRTRFALRLEVLELHMGFSLAGALSSTPATSATEQAPAA